MQQMTSTIEIMAPHDFPEVMALWESTPGVGINDADTPQKLAAYLERNPGMSFVARDAGQVVAAVLCGTDGRRGYLHHLAVASSHRRQGLGRAMVHECIQALGRAGYSRCHIMVFADNHQGKAFWRDLGWQEREDIRILSYDIDAPDGAC